MIAIHMFANDAVKADASIILDGIGGFSSVAVKIGRDSAFSIHLHGEDHLRRARALAAAINEAARPLSCLEEAA